MGRQVETFTTAGNLSLHSLPPSLPLSPTPTAQPHINNITPPVTALLSPSQWLHHLTRTQHMHTPTPSRKCKCIQRESQQTTITNLVPKPWYHKGEATSLAVSPSWSGSAHDAPLHAPSDPDTGKTEEMNGPPSPHIPVHDEGTQKSCNL